MAARGLVWRGVPAPMAVGLGLVGLATGSVEAAGVWAAMGLGLHVLGVLFAAAPGLAGRFKPRSAERDRRGRPVDWPPLGGLRTASRIGVGFLGLALWLASGAWFDGWVVQALLWTLGPVVEQAGLAPAPATQLTFAIHAPGLMGEAADLLVVVHGFGWLTVCGMVAAALPGLGRSARIDRVRRPRSARLRRLGGAAFMVAACGFALVHVDPQPCRRSGALLHCSGVMSVMLAAGAFVLLGFALAQGVATGAAMLGFAKAQSGRPRR